MADTVQLFETLVAPAIFVSAAALLALSLNVRLMGMVTRLRQFQRDKHLATSAGRQPEAQALADQIVSIEKRAERIRLSFLFSLLCLAGTILSCLLLGLTHYWPAEQVLAIFVFVAAIVALLIAAPFYIGEVAVALSSVREEAQYYRFMHLSGEAKAPPERRDTLLRAG